jgi:hypothetical protein
MERMLASSGKSSLIAFRTMVKPLIRTKFLACVNGLDD